MRLALLLAAALAALPGPAPGAPRVAIAQGELEGVRVDGVDRFLGIPFAAAPVGPLRWRAPQPAPGWDGVRPAATPGPDCYQDTAHNPLGPDHHNAMSEDCLTLNIWRPAAPAEAPRPVMVWIHGGAFIMGSGAMPAYDGARLARQDVVVVTLNYRLGRFGTFATPALIAAQANEPVANYGLLDQIAALRWVRDNIARFGGDPANVTIFGESAGASSVNFLMASPLARGLFAKAISQSGGASANLSPLAKAAADGLAWSQRHGIADGDPAALRALPAETVLDAPVTLPVFPVIDGTLLVQSTPEAFATGNVAPVPYLVGANDREESLLRWLPGVGDRFFADLGDQGEPLIARYQRPGEPRADTIARIWGEAAMTLPARSRARAMAARGAPVWLYRYAYVPEALRASVPGAGHEAEIEMVFGNPGRAAAPVWTAADAAMARIVSGYWIAFARSGDPNHAGAVAWPRATSDGDGDALIEFTAQGAQVRHAFARDRLDALEAATR